MWAIRVCKRDNPPLARFNLTYTSAPAKFCSLTVEYAFRSRFGRLPFAIHVWRLSTQVCAGIPAFRLPGQWDASRSRRTYGTKNHLALEGPDCARAVAILKARPAAKEFRMEDMKVGVNRKRQVNVYDPDGSRVELLEPTTIDGKPTPPSVARPPIP